MAPNPKSPTTATANESGAIVKDQETLAMNALNRALSPLDQAAKDRVLDYGWSRWHSPPPPMPAEHFDSNR